VSFDRRAATYERGRLGEWHRLVAARTAGVALAEVPSPACALDVGCGTGMLLRELAAGLSGTAELVGVDPAPYMLVEARRQLGHDSRVHVEEAAAERLPFADASFDLVVSVTSFDHWADQLQGLLECARVLRRSGRLVLADLFAPWLLPTTISSRRARTPRQASRLLARAGLPDVTWRRVYDLGPFPLVQAALAAPSVAHATFASRGD
jgi:ubiquinone/menaquinone biosynthesis C-methylase UbiE